MDEAIWQFRLFERASLNYLGTSPDDHADHPLGLWDRTITEKDLVERDGSHGDARTPAPPK